MTTTPLFVSRAWGSSAVQLPLPLLLRRRLHTICLLVGPITRLCEDVHSHIIQRYERGHALTIDFDFPPIFDLFRV